MPETKPLSRQEIIDKLEWNEGGFGFEMFSVASSAMDEPRPGHPDLKSIIVVCGSPDKYTDEELRKILKFAERKTAAHDKTSRYRRGANLILIDKPNWSPGRWFFKRLTWRNGSIADSLDEAIAMMERI